jgi:hypothetical protein
VTANQAGNANYAAAAPVPLTFTINPAVTTTVIATSVSPSVQGQLVTFTATVSPATAGGTVTFKDGPTGTVSGGIATFQTAALTAGSHMITASYAGSSNYGASTSTAITQTVTANGTIVLRVLTTDGDGTFVFSSSTASLIQSLTFSGGSALGSSVSLNAGLCMVSVSLPAGHVSIQINLHLDHACSAPNDALFLRQPC